jgi:hypothetical protein
MKGFLLIGLLLALLFPTWTLALGVMIIILVKVLGMFVNSSGLSGGSATTRVDKQ